MAAISPGAADVLATEFHVPRDRIRFVGQGRHLHDFPVAGPAERAAARRSLGVDAGTPVVLSLGALAPEKRIDVLVDAMADVPGATLLVAGEGPLRAALEERGRAVLGERVRFLGPVHDPLVALSASDVLAMTSDSEGLPGAGIEAALVGLPVVATDVGFLRDIVEDRRTGFLVPRRDPARTAAALRDALADSRRLGAAGRELCAERFDLDLVVWRWEGLLDDLSRPETC